MALTPEAYLSTLRQVKGLSSLLEYVSASPAILDRLIAHTAEPGASPLGSGNSYLDTAFRNIGRLIPPAVAESLLKSDRIRRWLSRVFLSESDPDLRKRASKFAGCRRNYMVSSNRDGNLLLIPYTCSSSLCPSCAAQKSADYLYRVLHHLHSLKFAKRLATLDLRFITLTVRNVPHGQLRSATERLLIAFRQLRRQESSGWSSIVRGYMWNLEVTHNAKSDTWHPHIHVLADGDYWPQSDLDMKWKSFAKTRGFAAHADIRQAKPRKENRRPSGDLTAKDNALLSVLLEVTKYTLKPIGNREISSRQVLELFRALHNKRLRGTAGTLRIPPLEKGDPEWSLLGGLGQTFDDNDSFFWDDPEGQDILLDLIFRDKDRLIELARSYSVVATVLKADGLSPNES